VFRVERNGLGRKKTEKTREEGGFSTKGEGITWDIGRKKKK
jgi:hypothetical protein